MTKYSIPEWSLHNLHEHVITRNFEDRECWEEILGHGNEMTEAEYERESESAYTNGLYEYEGKDSKKEHGHALYRVDGRAIKTIASLDRRRMITCYHIDQRGKHQPGSASADHPLETALQQMEALEMRMESRVASVTDFDLIEENLPDGTQKSRAWLMERGRNLKKQCVRNR